MLASINKFIQWHFENKRKTYNKSNPTLNFGEKEKEKKPNKNSLIEITSHVIYILFVTARYRAQ